jgi:hypothetical protein
VEEIRCRICDSSLSVAGLRGRRTPNGALPGSAKVKLHRDGMGHYFMCPYCSARNVTIVTNARNGRPAVQVAWAVMNGD